MSSFYFPAETLLDEVAAAESEEQEQLAELQLATIDEEAQRL